MQRTVAIVGAGVTGLVAGRELARRGYAVTLYERWPDVAGQASAFDVGGGVWVERYYHHLFQSDREMIALHDELLPSQLEWHRSTVGIWARGRVWPFVSPLDLLRYRPLAPVDRLRLGLAMLRLVRRDDWERMDDIAALDWLRAECGERAVASVWTPLLFGKFGRDAGRVPLAWLWSKLTLRRRKLAGSSATKELLGYPRGSFRAICVALADDLRRRGGTIHLDREVMRVDADGDAFALRCAGPGAYRASALPDAARDGHAGSPTGRRTTHRGWTTGRTRPRSSSCSSCASRSATCTGRTSRIRRCRSSVWWNTPTSCRPSVTQRATSTCPTTCIPTIRWPRWTRTRCCATTSPRSSR
jgi:protoporphyrinogen oxidase